LSTFLKALAFLVAVCCLSWLGVLWWWQRTGHNPEAAEVLVYLGLLPLVLAAVVWGGHWLWRRAGARTPAAVGGAGAASSAGEATAVVAAEAAERHAVMQVVRFQAHSVAGDQAADLLEAAHAGKPLPQPDAVLTNDDGLPVLCARMADKALALDAVRAELESLLPGVLHAQSEHALTELSEHVLRALAALRPVIEAQRDGLWALHQAQLNALPDGGASLERLPPAQRPPLPGLRVLLGWPAAWSAAEQALGQAWVTQCLHDEQANLAMGYALMISPLAGSGEDVWLRADQLAHGSVRTPWLLVLACDSLLDGGRVDALASGQRLYDASVRPGGCIPGEGAAGLLLAPADWTPPPGLEVETVLVHRPALMRRDKSIEAAGRVSHQVLEQALEQSLVAAQLGAADLAQLVCDADQHSPRGTELYGLAVAALHHLDPVDDMRLLGRVTGHTGTASPLLVLAAAADAAKGLRQPVLALTLADPHLRMAMVFKPAAAPPAAGA
jgi:hypothetical protein